MDRGLIGWSKGTAIVIPVGIAKELSLLARFEKWLIRLRLPQNGILGLLTHGTRNVAVLLYEEYVWLSKK